LENISVAAARPNDPAKVREFYDLVSTHFHELWGQHLHHGYWIRGDETKEQAQDQLIKHLAEAAKMRPGQAILDVGCGTGASSIYLSKKYNVHATGISISPVQVALANDAAAREPVDAKFLVMDAEAMKFQQPFDVIWSVESISHYQDIPGFFAAAAGLLVPGGTIAVIDWFKGENLTAAQYRREIAPIEKGMLVELATMPEYLAWMQSNGLKITQCEVLNKNCAKTWDLGLDIIKNRALWKLAATNGAMFVRFLKAFRAMRAGFASERFVYGLIVAQKN
jgi:tocopherol O-methyltransferase